MEHLYGRRISQVFAMMASAIHSFNESLRSISRPHIHWVWCEGVKDFNDLMNQESEVMLGEHEPSSRQC